MYSYMSLTLALGAGVCIGYLAAYIRLRRGAVPRGKDKIPRVLSRDGAEDYKMVLVVRNDLRMGKGKACAQCAHGATSMYHNLIEEQEYQLIENWFHSGQKKVVVKVESLEEMRAIEDSAEGLGVRTESVRDAGHTQVAPGTQTVLCVGPGIARKIDNITGHLKLY